MDFPVPASADYNLPLADVAIVAPPKADSFAVLLVCETARRHAEQSYQMATIIVSIFDHSNNLVQKDATAMIDSQPGTITLTGRVYTALNVGDTYNLVAKDGKHASILVDWSSGNSSTFKFLSLCPW
jgi:hypothetical protein